MKLELVTWTDAGSREEDQTWLHPDLVTEDDNPVVQSVGWVVKETAKNLTLAMDWADDGDTHTRSRIPIGMIVKREVLKEL